jgi:ABC-type nitrate/sulfonate/bicarbonate transport system permease component
MSIAVRLIRLCAGLALFLLLWQAAISLFHVPTYLVPTPQAVGIALLKQHRVLLRQTGFTMSAAAIGLLASTLFAVLLAASFIRYRGLERASLPFVVAFRSAPVPAIAPLAMMALGRGMATSVAVVLLVSFFPLLVNLLRGLRAVDRNEAELLHVYGASVWQSLWYLRAPAALPYLFTGLRVAGASAILGAMLSEWITGSHGLGNLILESGEMREVELLWAAVLISVTIALLVFGLTAAAERRVLRWKPKFV